MYKDFKVCDADAHIYEPHDLWTDYIEKEFYDRRPLIPPREPGQRGLRSNTYLPCELFPDGTQVRAISKTETTKKGERELGTGMQVRNNYMKDKYGDAYDDEFSVESRLADMTRLGWDKMVLVDNFPSPMRAIHEGADQALLWACARAYNNWCYDFAQTDSSRLKMVGIVPNQHDPEGLIRETRRCVEELGAVTMAVPIPAKNKAWHDPQYNAYWALAEELDFPMSFHGVMSGLPHVASRYQPRSRVSGPEIALDHAAGFAMENMVSMGHLIFLGILERFPKMRVSFLEGNSGWLPFWLGRLDDHCLRNSRQGMWFDSDALPLKPSEYFLRQGFVACDPDEFGLKGVVMLVGEDNIVWNTDYSHPDAPDTDDAVPALLAQEIPESAMRKILWDNSVRLYGQRLLT